MKLFLSNFRCFQEDTTFIFKEGTTLIAGVSGIGKSTILDAISFALYGYRGSVSSHGNEKKPTKVVLEIEDMIITRSKPPNRFTLCIKNEVNEPIRVKDNIISETKTSCIAPLDLLSSSITPPHLALTGSLTSSPVPLNLLGSPRTSSHFAGLRPYEPLGSALTGSLTSNHNLYEETVAQEIIYFRFGKYFGYTGYLHQRSLDSFIGLSPGDKLKVLEGLALNTDLNLTKLKAKIQEEMRDTNNKLASLSGQQNAITQHASSFNCSVPVFPLLSAQSALAGSSTSNDVSAEAKDISNHLVIKEMIQEKEQSLHKVRNDISLTKSKMVSYREEQKSSYLERDKQREHKRELEHLERSIKELKDEREQIEKQISIVIENKEDKVKERTNLQERTKSIQKKISETERSEQLLYELEKIELEENQYLKMRKEYMNTAQSELDRLPKAKTREDSSHSTGSLKETLQAQYNKYCLALHAKKELDSLIVKPLEPVGDHKDEEIAIKAMFKEYQEAETEAKQVSDSIKQKEIELSEALLAETSLVCPECSTKLELVNPCHPSAQSLSNERLRERSDRNLEMLSSSTSPYNTQRYLQKKSVIEIKSPQLSSEVSTLKQRLLYINNKLVELKKAIEQQGEKIKQCSRKEYELQLENSRRQAVIKRESELKAVIDHLFSHEPVSNSSSFSLREINEPVRATCDISEPSSLRSSGSSLRETIEEKAKELLKQIEELGKEEQTESHRLHYLSILNTPLDNSFQKRKDLIVSRLDTTKPLTGSSTLKAEKQSLLSELQFIQSSQYELEDSLKNIEERERTRERAKQKALELDNTIKLKLTSLQEQVTKEVRLTSRDSGLIELDIKQTESFLSSLEIKERETVHDVRLLEGYARDLERYNQYLALYQSYQAVSAAYQAEAIVLDRLSRMKQLISSAEDIAFSSFLESLNLQLSTYLTAFFAHPISVSLNLIQGKPSFDIIYKGIPTSIDQLSGGEATRVELALLLVLSELLNPPLLMLDESLASLDTETSELIIDFLSKYKRKYTLIVAHQTTQGLFDHSIFLE